MKTVAVIKLRGSLTLVLPNHDWISATSTDMFRLTTVPIIMPFAYLFLPLSLLNLDSQDQGLQSSEFAASSVQVLDRGCSLCRAINITAGCRRTLQSKTWMSVEHKMEGAIFSEEQTQTTTGNWNRRCLRLGKAKVHQSTEECFQR